MPIKIWKLLLCFGFGSNVDLDLFRFRFIIILNNRFFWGGSFKLVNIGKFTKFGVVGFYLNNNISISFKNFFYWLFIEII